MLMGIRSAGTCIVGSVSDAEHNWGGPEALAAFFTGITHRCVRFSRPHGWESGATVTEVISTMTRGNRVV